MPRSRRAARVASSRVAAATSSAATTACTPPTSRRRPPARPPAACPTPPSGRCPWYVDGLCRNRAGRPLGCRVYFCDPGWESEMPAVYERYHAELRAVHDRHGLPYRYRLFVEAARDEVAP